MLVRCQGDPSSPIALFLLAIESLPSETASREVVEDPQGAGAEDRVDGDGTEPNLSL
jgi:hypothetical protein